MMLGCLRWIIELVQQLAAHGEQANQLHALGISYNLLSHNEMVD